MSILFYHSYLTCFVGAGVSTSAGIGDYRGKSGKWTQQDQASVNMDSVFASEHEHGKGKIFLKVQF